MSLFDLLLIVIVGSSVIAGFAAGFARVGIGFLAAILGTLFGFWFYGIPAAWIRSFISSKGISDVLGFLVVFFGFLLAGGILGRIVSKFFKWTGLSWLDRLLGAAFGFIRGSLIAAAFVAVILAFTPKPTPNWMLDSKTLPYAVGASNMLASLAPRSIRQAFDEQLDDIRKGWDQQLRQGREKLGLPQSSPAPNPLKKDTPEAVPAPVQSKPAGPSAKESAAPKKVRKKSDSKSDLTKREQ
jgi:membrane protein required for colicin V production